MERYSALLGHAAARIARRDPSDGLSHERRPSNDRREHHDVAPAASSDAAVTGSAETSLLAKQLAMADRARAPSTNKFCGSERMAEAARAQEAELAGRLRHAETQVAEALHDRARFDAAREEVERQLEAARAALEAARADASRQRAETAEAVGKVERMASALEGQTAQTAQLRRELDVQREVGAAATARADELARELAAGVAVRSHAMTLEAALAVSRARSAAGGGAPTGGRRARRRARARA